MKNLIYLLLALACLAACVPVQVPPTIALEKDALSAQHWNVAVLDLNYEFEEPGTMGITKYQSAGRKGGQLIARILSADLAELPNFTIVDREDTDKVLAELALQQTGVVDVDSARKIGELTGADAVITGELSDYVIWDTVGSTGSTVSFSIRMIDTKSGRVLLNASISRARPLVDSFANVQLTCKELVDGIKNR